MCITILNCSKTYSFVKDSRDFMQKIKLLSINPEQETLISFDDSALFTSKPVPVLLQVINFKISTYTNFTNVCRIPTEKASSFWNSLSPNCIFCSNQKFYNQLQVEAMGTPVSLSLQIST